MDMIETRVQFAESESANFVANTWTFHMDGNCGFQGGRFAILPEHEYSRLYNLIESLQSERDAALTTLAIEEAEQRCVEEDRDEARATLKCIGDIAHERSTGPTVPDVLWELRQIAYDAYLKGETK